MIISKEQLKCTVCSDADRPELNAVCFTTKGAISTDGKRILIVPYPKAKDDGLFDSFEVTSDSSYQLKGYETILITADNAAHIASSFFKKTEVEDPDMTLALIDKNNEHNKTTISITNGDLRKEFSFEINDHKFPKIEHVLPVSPVTFEVTFLAEIFIDLLKNIKNSSGCASFKFNFHGELGVVEILANGTEVKTKGYIMPMRGE